MREGPSEAGSGCFGFQVQSLEPARREDSDNLAPRRETISRKLPGRVITKIPTGKRVAVHGEEVARRHHGDIHFVILAGVEEQARTREGKMVERSGSNGSRHPRP